jgi:hypothetical protein
MTIFKEDGLMQAIPNGKRVIADRGYQGASEVVSYRNDLDNEDIKDLKRRALSRHEAFNGRLANFKALQELFRHSHEKHSIAFDAVIVICHLELENGNPLFDA